MPECNTTELDRDLLNQLVQISRKYGSDPRMVLAGGGNTSLKLGDRLMVKASGCALTNIDVGGFVELDRAKLQHLLESTLPAERSARELEFKKHVMAARCFPEKAQRPSVEALLHHIMPGRFVVHSHSTVVNAFTCCMNGQKLVQELLGDEVIWLDSVDPGHVLARTLDAALKEHKARTAKARPRAVIMQNHGLVVCGDTAQQVDDDTRWVLSQLAQKLGRISREGDAAFGPRAQRDAAEVRRQVSVIAPALRGLLAEGAGDALKIVTFDDTDAVLQLTDSLQGPAITSGGPLSPDQIVYCKSFPLWFDAVSAEDPKATVKRLAAAVQQHAAQHRVGPRIILVKGVGMFAAGDDYNSADTARLVYADAIQVMAGAQSLGGIQYLAPDFREFIENWEVESYRRQVSAGARAKGRTAGKIAIVTGAAQGFGLEISRHFAAEGGCVVLTDVNADGAAKAAKGICDEFGGGRAFGLPVNVTDGASIEQMIHQVVRTYGGFDVFISNAGVLKAGSVKTQPEKDFDFVTAVNYRGFFLCTQKASHILSVQRMAKADYWSDIIQINSKSGLRGSNKNGAYAGGKFGGIGLVESFALELVEDGIKVNAICPGNFYDGPLWSDPKNGLFVQYLNTGKVPGAKTIEDVRKFYEAQAPIRRGCTTPDVMKAVYYLIDQVYETGQALPVTGGQVMLK